MDKETLIEHLKLEPHVEGGYFRRIYASRRTLAANEVVKEETKLSRPVFTSIYYMLTADSPIGCLHRNRSDIVHYFLAGSPLEYTLLLPDGGFQRYTMGPHIDKGHRLSLVVAGGVWKATELKCGEYGLVAEAVSPGFVYEDMEIADRSVIESRYPQHFQCLTRYIKNTQV